jgi:hypothetical protein
MNTYAALQKFITERSVHNYNTLMKLHFLFSAALQAPDFVSFLDSGEYDVAINLF